MAERVYIPIPVDTVQEAAELPSLTYKLDLDKGRIVGMVDGQEAVRQETDHFLNRVYHGSLSLMVSTFTEKQKLSREEIDGLYEILRKAEEEAHD